MKKVKVIKEFPDRYTGKKRIVGEEFEVSDARLLEIRRSGKYVEVVKETAPTKEPKVKEKK